MYDMSLAGPIPSFLGNSVSSNQAAWSVRSEFNSWYPVNTAEGTVNRCTVEGTSVSSVHGQTMNLPASSVSACEVIVAKDCQASGKFVVLSSPASTVTETSYTVDANTRVVKVIVPGASVVVASSRSSVVCYVNGKPVSVSSSPVSSMTESGLVIRWIDSYIA